MRDDLIQFSLFMATGIAIILGLVFMLGLTIEAHEDNRAEENCLKYGKASGIEVKPSNRMCFINDEEFGWITYQERKAQRFAERGMKND